MDLESIKRAICAGRVRVTDHADEEAFADELQIEDIRRSVVVGGEIIEDYPTDRPFPSCLIYGQTVRGDPVHTVWAYNDANQWAVLVTVYRPDPDRWINWRERRTKR